MKKSSITTTNSILSYFPDDILYNCHAYETHFLISQSVYFFIRNVATNGKFKRSIIVYNVGTITALSSVSINLLQMQKHQISIHTDKLLSTTILTTNSFSSHTHCVLNCDFRKLTTELSYNKFRFSNEVVHVGKNVTVIIFLLFEETNSIFVTSFFGKHYTEVNIK